MDMGAVVLVIVTAALNAAVSLAVVRVELRYLRRDIDAAHKRLDALYAPSGYSGQRAD